MHVLPIYKQLFSRMSYLNLYPQCLQEYLVSGDMKEEKNSRGEKRRKRRRMGQKEKIDFWELLQKQEY